MKNGMAIGLKILGALILLCGVLCLAVSAVSAGDPGTNPFVGVGFSGIVLALLVFGFASLLERVAEIEYHLRLMASGQPPGQPPVEGPNRAGGRFTELKL